MESENLPKLTQQQQNFLLRYFSNGKNASDAYRYAYNSENTKDSTIWSEASKLLKNPKVTPWVLHYESSRQEVIENEIKYTVDDAFEELQSIQNRAMKSDKLLQVAIKAIEHKSKLKGLYKEDNQQKSVQINTMGTVLVDDKPLELKVGQEVETYETE